MLRRKFTSGFSLIEVVIVLAIALILTTIAVAGFRGIRTNLKTVKSANVLTSLLQQARQRAISNRIPHSVTISRANDSFGKRNLITIISIDTAKSPIVTNVIRQEYLLQDVTLTRPTNVPLTPASASPFAPPPEDVFQQMTFVGMQTITIFFNIDGSVTSGNYFPIPGSNPFTASFYLADTNQPATATPNPGLTRVVSLYSSTGGVKTWSYDGTRYQTGNKNF